MNETTVCAICGEPYRFRWTDTHGIGACTTCGAPYRLYHYEGEGAARRRVQKPAELMLKDEWVPLAQRYWNEHHRNVDPGGFNSGGSTYEVARAEDFKTFNNWMEAHRSEWPKEIEVPA